MTMSTCRPAAGHTNIRPRCRQQPRSRPAAPTRGASQVTPDRFLDFGKCRLLLHLHLENLKLDGPLAPDRLTHPEHVALAGLARAQSRSNHQFGFRQMMLLHDV